MSASEQTARLLRQWLELTRSETAAIRAGNWEKFEALQSEKSLLRDPLRQARSHWLSGGGGAPHGPPEESMFRATIGRLIVLEEQNARLVAECQRKARGQIRELGQAARNLLRIKESYARGLPAALIGRA